MAFWVVLIIYVALTVGYELLRPKQKFDTPTPGSLGDIRTPTIGEGRSIPIVWGTCKLEGPMVTWYGDLDVVPIKKKVKTGLWSSEDVTTGYKYYLGMQLVLCSGEVSGIGTILFDDKAPSQGQTVQGDHWRVTLDDPGLFGGEESEGGIQGNVDVYQGSQGQAPNDYLETTLGEDHPGWPGICYAVFRRVYIGTSPYLKNVSVIVKRWPNSLGLLDGHDIINDDANPACMIHDLLTRPLGKNGLGIPEGLLDLTSFREVGDVLALEELGLSMLQDRTTSARDLLLEILRHIDGIIFVEPSTGLLKLNLVRFDYSVGGLPILDKDNCTVKTYARPAWSELKNTVRVTYVDRSAGYIERMVQAQDLASITASGGQVSIYEMQLRGLTTATNAQQAVARGLVALGYPLASLVIEADRTAWSFRPGTVFKLNWAPLGITGLVCRVIRIKGGNLTSGMIEIDALEDIFAVDWTAYTAPPATGWIDPVSDVPELTDQAVLQATYEAVKLYGVQGGDVQFATVMASRGQPGVSSGYNVYVAVWPLGSWQPPTQVPFFTPSGTLESAVVEGDDEISVLLGPDIDEVVTVGDDDFAQGVNVAWIKQESGLQEFIAFKTVTVDTGKIILQDIARGCLDTAPTAFNAGTRVWFISYGSSVVNMHAPAGGGLPQNLMRFQAYNNQGDYPFGAGHDESVDAIDPPRSARVYCPTDVQFNGLSYPDEISGELTVSFEYRNRVGTWNYANSGKTDNSEPGTAYQIKVYGESDTLIHTEPLTGKTWTYLEPQEIADSGLGRLNNHLRVEIRTFDGDLVEAFRVIEWEFDRV